MSHRRVAIVSAAALLMAYLSLIHAQESCCKNQPVASEPQSGPVEEDCCKKPSNPGADSRVQTASPPKPPEDCCKGEATDTAVVRQEVTNTRLDRAPADAAVRSLSAPAERR